MAMIETPHIHADKEAFGRTVLMPGDPLRAKFIAENFLENAKLVNNIRGIQGYTGYYKGVKTSVMASGMGMPSIGIYSYELFHFFDVQNILRVGTAGSFQEKIGLRELVFGMGACTTSRFAENYHLPGTFAPICDFGLLKEAVALAEEKKISYHVGNVLSSDVFYGDDPSDSLKWQKMGVLCVEMESAALYMNAARCQKHALSVLTVSDSMVTGEETTAEERQSTFTGMMEVALGIAVKEG